MRISPLAGIVLLALSASAVAQMHFCIGGDLDALTPAQVTSCKAKATGLRTAASVQGTPNDWHFVVICDEAGWSDYASFSGNRRAQVMRVSENTDRDLRWTFIRGSRMETGNKHDVELVLASARKDMRGLQMLIETPHAAPAMLALAQVDVPKLDRP